MKVVTWGAEQSRAEGVWDGGQYTGCGCDTSEHTFLHSSDFEDTINALLTKNEINKNEKKP